MKKLFTFVLLFVSFSGFSQANNSVSFKSNGYVIDGRPYLEPDTILKISESEIDIKSVGTMKIIKKAISVRNTSVYNCEFQGKPVEVITVISTEKLKVTIRGENLKHIIESDLIDPTKIKEEFSKSQVSVSQ